MIAVHGDAGRAKRERTKAPISALQRDCEKNTKGKEKEKGERTLTPFYALDFVEATASSFVQDTAR
jgi:hypothetical protein